MHYVKSDGYFSNSKWWTTVADDRPVFLKFREFHEANPQVYNELRRLALDLHSRGRRQYGIMSLLNVVRWHRAMATTRDADDFKVNNNFAPYYARLLMHNERKLAGFFVLRHSRADEIDGDE